VKKCAKCGAALERQEAAFCSQCGTAVTIAQSRPDESKPANREEPTRLADLGPKNDRPPEQRCHLGLEVNNGRFYMEGKACAFHFRISNRTTVPIKNVSVCVTGKHLEGPERCELFLAPGLSREYPLDITPTRAGEPTIQVNVSYELDSTTYGFSARKIMKVFDKNVTPQNLTLYFDQSMHAGGDIGYGNSVRNEVKAALEKGLIHTVNDLIAHRLPERWEEIELSYDDRLTRQLRAAARQSVRVVPELASRRATLRKACLFLGDRITPERLLLLGMPQVRLGRSRNANDVVLRLLPRSSANDELSMQISNEHLLLELRREGLVLVDRESTCGTQLNGKPIDSEALVPLDDPSEVNVAGVLSLRLKPFLDTDPAEKAAAERYAHLGRPDRLWRTAEALKLRSLVIERMNNLSDREQYVVVFRWMNAGRAPDGELVIHQEDVEFDHLRIVRLSDQFWLEGLAENNQVSVAGVSIPPGWACPLSAGMKLEFGGVPAEFRAFEQHAL